jgi:hypothetical protein
MTDCTYDNECILGKGLAKRNTNDDSDTCESEKSQ